MYDRSKVTKEAWAIARHAAETNGGKARDYYGAALREVWAFLNDDDNAVTDNVVTDNVVTDNAVTDNVVTDNVVTETYRGCQVVRKGRFIFIRKYSWTKLWIYRSVGEYWNYKKADKAIKEIESVEANCLQYRFCKQNE